MRQFKLINASGKEFDLMRKDAFLHGPQGLGFDTETEVQRVGHTFVELRSDEAQPMPGGEMVFGGYAQYDEFRAFVAVGGLVLAYKPTQRWRYLDVTVSLGLSEIERGSHRLRCAVEFCGLSQWYEQLQLFKSVGSENEGKVYDYSYGYTYADAVSGRIEIKNGNLPSYPRITIMGPVVNPAWTLYQGGRRVASGRVLAEIITGRKLVVDANPATMEISEYTSTGNHVADLYGLSDFDTERLFELPAGESSLAFTQTGSGTVNAWLEVRRRV